MMQLVRFFHCVDGHPFWMWMLTLVVGGYAIAVTWIAPAESDSALMMLLLWQMLCASRGFARAAANGWFDPILIRAPRARLAIAHALHATLPVGAAWVLVGFVEVIRGSASVGAFDPGRMSAFVFTSVAAWALSLPAGRLVTGTLWLALIVAAAATPLGLGQLAAMLARPDGMARLFHAAAIAVVCPFVMFEGIMPARGRLAAVLTLASVMALWAGIRFVRRRSFPLEPAA